MYMYWQHQYLLQAFVICDTATLRIDLLCELIDGSIPVEKCVKYRFFSLFSYKKDIASNKAVHDQQKKVGVT